MTTNPYAATGSGVTGSGMGVSNAPPPTTEGRYCIRCAYALAGLPPGGECPECGTSIELSLREPRLANSDAGYRRKVRSGLSLVLNGILLQIICVFVAIFGAALLGAMGSGSVQQLTLGLQGVMVAVSVMIMLGYWKYTEPDPSQVAMEKTSSARSMIRVVVLSQVAIVLCQAAIAVMVETSPSQTGTAQTGPSALEMAGMAAGLISVVLWAVQYFTVMRYTRWLATRVPDVWVVKRTKVYMWLLPLMATVGIALLIGPLLSLVMYWNLLDRMRKHLKSIERTGEPAALKKMAAVG